MKRLALMVMLLLIVAPSPARAQCDWAGAWWKSQAVGQRLALVPEQRARIDTLYEAARPRLRDLQQTLLQQQRALDQVMREPESDRPTVDRSIEAVEQARTALSKARAHLLLDMRQVLDATQRRALTEFATAGCGGSQSPDRARRSGRARSQNQRGPK